MMTRIENSLKMSPKVVNRLRLLAMALALSTIGIQDLAALRYKIVDTGQGRCFDDSRAAVPCPDRGEAFYGQDAQYSGNAPSYTDQGNGIISDHVTGLMWQKSPESNGDGVLSSADKMTYDEAMDRAGKLTVGGYSDWRLPTIKELYSLMLLDGVDPPSGGRAGSTFSLVPFIDNAYFDFVYGDPATGERIIDAQYASSTLYVSNTGNDGGRTLFGVNFADGRIKGYGLSRRGRDKTFFVIFVRGNPAYGKNEWVDNRDGSISDAATGLLWQQDDSGVGLDWADALAYCENLTTAGHTDWRLPNAKELQSLVDYSRSPDTTGSAAIDPLFDATQIINEKAQADFSAYWSSSTHLHSGDGNTAAYISFGRSLGYMRNNWVDVHGAGSQRSDPKSGDASDWPTGRGPQGDAIRIYNYARCVSGGDVTATPTGGPSAGRTEIQVEASHSDRPSDSGDGSRSGRQQSEGPERFDQRGERPRQPPPEAVEACVDLDRGVSCGFTSPHGRVKGSCMAIEGQLACVPTGGPRGRPPGQR